MTIFMIFSTVALIVSCIFAGYYYGQLKTYDNLQKFYYNMMDDMETRLPRIMKHMMDAVDDGFKKFIEEANNNETFGC